MKAIELVGSGVEAFGVLTGLLRIIIMELDPVAAGVGVVGVSVVVVAVVLVVSVVVVAVVLVVGVVMAVVVMSRCSE